MSERRFYQKVTDIYATSVDYDRKSPTTIKFFKKVQNKMHYAVSHQTETEIIYNRSDSEKEHMGLTSWKNSPNGKIFGNRKKLFVKRRIGKFRTYSFCIFGLSRK